MELFRNVRLLYLGDFSIWQSRKQLWSETSHIGVHTFTQSGARTVQALRPTVYIFLSAQLIANGADQPKDKQAISDKTVITDCNLWFTNGSKMVYKMVDANGSRKRFTQTANKWFTHVTHGVQRGELVAWKLFESSAKWSVTNCAFNLLKSV